MQGCSSRSRCCRPKLPGLLSTQRVFTSANTAHPSPALEEAEEAPGGRGSACGPKQPGVGTRRRRLALGLIKLLIPRRHGATRSTQWPGRGTLTWPRPVLASATQGPLTVPKRLRFSLSSFYVTPCPPRPLPTLQTPGSGHLWGAASCADARAELLNPAGTATSREVHSLTENRAEAAGDAREELASQRGQPLLGEHLTAIPVRLPGRGHVRNQLRPSGCTRAGDALAPLDCGGNGLPTTRRSPRGHIPRSRCPGSPPGSLGEQVAGARGLL